MGHVNFNLSLPELIQILRYDVQTPTWRIPCLTAVGFGAEHPPMEKRGAPKPTDRHDAFYLVRVAGSFFQDIIVFRNL